MIPHVFFPSILIQVLGDFLTGEYFLDIGGMILAVNDKDFVRERHFDGVSVTGTSVLSQKYYDPFTGTEIDYKPATGKEIQCYATFSAQGTAGQTSTFRVWAGTTKDSISGARDVFGRTFTSQVANPPTVTPPFMLQTDEYLTVERISGSGTGISASSIVGVERDAT